VTQERPFRNGASHASKTRPANTAVLGFIAGDPGLFLDKLLIELVSNTTS